MHKLGMIPHGRLAEIGEHLGISTLTEEHRVLYHQAAVRLGTIFMDGIIRDYTHKKSNGRAAAAQ